MLKSASVETHFFFFWWFCWWHKSQNRFHISFCMFCTLSNMHYLFTCTNLLYSIFFAQVGVYGTLRSSFMQRVGCEGSESVLQAQCDSVGISVEIQRRGYEACYSLDSETWWVQPILFHQISFICVLYHQYPEGERGFLSSSHLSTVSLFFKSWFQSWSVIPTVEGNSTASKVP